MRKVKFIAWERELKEIIQVYDINFETDIINSHSAWRMFSEIDLMEYTGVDDMNGEEIYEDYLCVVYGEDSVANGIIKFHQGCFVFEELNTDFILRLCDLKINGYQIKVVGNIYQTPVGKDKNK